jgi:H+/Cl- antiporter ClcA
MVRFYMVELESLRDLVWFLVLASASGVIGAFVAELMIGRGKKKETGMFELPRRTGRFWDLGSFVSVPFGVVAAVLAGFFFSPLEEIEPTTMGAEATTEYDVVKLIAIGLLAGLASASFLKTARERFLSLLTTERVTQALELAHVGISELRDGAQRDAAGGTSEAAAKAEVLQTQIRSTLRGLDGDEGA